MKQLEQPTSIFLRRADGILSTASAAFIWLLLLVGVARGAVSRHEFHHDNVLGTSFELIVWVDSEAAAVKAEKAALAEIDRLALLLSTYDPKSEISRLNATNGPMICSKELVELLAGYDQWSARSTGAISGQLGGCIRLWQAAEKAGKPPAAEALAAWVAATRAPAWTLNRKTREVCRTNSQTIDDNSLGKGYIIGKAVAAATAAAPSLQGILLNLGGDLRANGNGAADEGVPWEIAVADPQASSENAKPLTRLKISDRAVSTSGSYQRGYDIGGVHYSHIIDPRTGRPADAVISATVVAQNNLIANALATALCVLGPEAGLALVQKTEGAEAIIVEKNGRQHRSPGFKAFETKPGAAPAINPAWPKGYRLELALQLKTPAATPKGYRKPYVAAWIEDKSGKPVRTLTVWGNAQKYLKDLPAWWANAKTNRTLISSVTRATRPAGKYSLIWNGLDDDGKPVPAGTYTVALEVVREHGSRALQRAEIVCADQPATAVIPAGSEFAAAPLTFGPVNH
jgi:thiamine biosynthesis lipoprotein ApbE